MLDLSRQQGKELTADDLMQACAFIEAESDEGFLLERVLLKTGYDGSSSDYSYLSPDAMLLLRSRSVLLVGIDSPQIDAPGQKSNEVFMRHNKISWIANLNLESTRSDRQYLLAALPLLHRRDSVVPIRAVLIDPTEAD